MTITPPCDDVSGTAMHRVLVDGPDRSDPLVWVVLAVADFPDTDLGEAGCSIGSRQIAQRARLSNWWTRELLKRAVSEGWLTVVRPSNRRFGPVYRLGDNFSDRALRARSDRAPRAETSVVTALSERESEREDRAQTLRSKRTEAPAESAGALPAAAAPLAPASGGTWHPSMPPTVNRSADPADIPDNDSPLAKSDYVAVMLELNRQTLGRPRTRTLEDR